MSKASVWMSVTKLSMLASIILTVVTVSCAVAPTFSGEAEFTDKGRSSYWPRFEILFPPIALRSSAAYSYKLDVVPRTTFTLRMIPVRDGATLIPGKLSGPPEEFDLFWDLAAESDLTLRYRVLQDSRTLLDTGQQVFPHGWHYGVKGGNLPFLQPTEARIQVWTDLTVEFTVEASSDQELSSIELIPVLVGGGKDSW